VKKLTIDPSGIDLHETIERGVLLHGHLGPFLVAGIRMGLLALELLDSPGYFGLEVVSQAGSVTPLSCLNDGIQIGSGCTAGKGNLAIIDGKTPRAVFTCGDRSVEIELRTDVVASFPGSDMIEKSQELETLPLEELFAWKISPSA